MAALDLRCPRCRCNLGGYTPAIGAHREPTPGDSAVCFGCGACCVFTAELQLRSMTLEEWLNLPWEHKRLLSRATCIVALAGLDLVVPPLPPEQRH